MPATEAPAAERSTEEQLAWERRHRPRAAAAAFLGALLTLGAGVHSGIVSQDAPRGSLVESLGRVTDGAIGQQESLRLEFFRWYDERFTDLLIGAILTGAGALGMGAALFFLGLAVRFRRPEFSRGALYIPVVGAVLLAVARVLVAIGNQSVVSDVLAGTGSVDAVTDLQRSGLLTAAQIAELAGTICLGLGLVFVSLNAMRAGLLTRFMGVLGIIAGILFAFPILGGPLPVVQTFWFLAVGFLFFGRWPGGMPPAWERGEAVPWPSAAEQRAAREATEAGGGRPAETPASRGAAPQGSRKKRKRRG